MILKLARLTFCQCGYPMFRSYVKIGDPYEVDPASKRVLSYKCGGCNRIQKGVECVMAGPKNSRTGGYIPIQLFDIPG